MDYQKRENTSGRTAPGKSSDQSDSMKKQLRFLISEIGPFFRAYFLIIFILLIVQLPYLQTQSFSSWAFGGEGDAVYEINDHQDAEMVVTVGDDHLSGATIYGYLNELNLLFSDEKLILTVSDADSGELLTESVFKMVNHSQDSSDDTGIYFAFDKEIPKGTEVRARLHSEGFTNRGIFFELSDEALHDNVTILDGEVSEQTLCMSFKHKNKGLNLLRPLLFFLLEAALGIFLLIINRRYGIPVRLRNDAHGPAVFVKKNFTPARIAVITAVTAVCMLILTEYTKWSAVSRVSERYDADMVCIDDYQLSTRIAVKDDTVVEQVVHTGKRNFCGIGLAVQNNKDGEDSAKSSFYVSAKEKERLKNVSDTVKYVDGTLSVQVYDKETDELEAEGEYEVSTLGSISNVLSPTVKSTLVNNDKDTFVWIDFGKNIASSRDKEYRLVIRGHDTGENGIRLSSSNRTNDKLKLNGEEKKTVLCMVTLFDVNDGVSSWFTMITAGMFIAVLGIGVLIRVFDSRIEYVFLISSLCMGFLFSLIVPPYCVPDERTHVDTVYSLSNQLLGIRSVPGPNRIYKRTCDVDATIKNTMALSPYMYGEMSENLFGAAGEERELIPAYARNAHDNSTIINYIPGVAGLTIGRLLGRNMLTMLMMARWFNIVVVSWIMFLAIRKAPFGKGIFALIGLLPKMLNQNVSCSYDGMIIAGVYIFLAYTLHLLFEEKVSVTDLLVVVLSAWFLACNKGGAYLPLTGMLLLLPFLRKKRKRTCARIVGCIMGSVLLVFSFKFIVRITGMMSRSSGSIVKTAGKTTLYTLSDFFTDPGSLFRVFEGTFFLRGQNLFGDVIGINIAQQQINAPWITVIAFIILLLLASLPKEGDRVRFSIPNRLWIMLITLAGIGLVCLSMLLSWTEKGSESIEGLQGRYFLPYLILPFFCIQTGNIIQRKRDDKILIWIADILLFVVFCNLIIATFACPLFGNPIISG